MFKSIVYNYTAVILEQSTGARNRVVMALSYRPARLQLISWPASKKTRFLLCPSFHAQIVLKFQHSTYSKYYKYTEEVYQREWKRGKRRVVILFSILKVPSHQIRLGLKCYGRIGLLSTYKDWRW
jgi:hypothetical protein